MATTGFAIEPRFVRQYQRVKVVLIGRVLRGGSWNNNGRNVRSAQRNRNEPDNRNDNIGFRLAQLERVWMPLSTRPSSRLQFFAAKRKCPSVRQ